MGYVLAGAVIMLVGVIVGAGLILASINREDDK